MKKTLLKSKLHRINVTQVELNYEGSCAVDREFLELAGMQEYEKLMFITLQMAKDFLLT